MASADKSSKSDTSKAVANGRKSGTTEPSAPPISELSQPTSELSASTQNYLKIIWGLQEWADEPGVSTSEIAHKAGLRLSTVSGAMSKMAEQGLVHHAPYGGVELTEEGRAHALMMIRRHRLIESFLVSVLGYRWDQVHDEAEHLEHAASDFMISRIDAFLGHPARDPHGDPIPSPSGEITHPDAFPLTEIEPGSRVRIERISDDDADLLVYFAQQGIVVGAHMEVSEGAPYSDALEIKVDGAAPVSLGRVAANAMWVSVLEAPAAD